MFAVKIPADNITSGEDDVQQRNVASGREKESSIIITMCINVCNNKVTENFRFRFLNFCDLRRTSAQKSRRVFLQFFRAKNRWGGPSALFVAKAKK
jgi:hypothetical protein